MLQIHSITASALKNTSARVLCLAWLVIATSLISFGQNRPRDQRQPAYGQAPSRQPEGRQPQYRPPENRQSGYRQDRQAQEHRGSPQERWTTPQVQRPRSEPRQSQQRTPQGYSGSGDPRPRYSVSPRSSEQSQRVPRPPSSLGESRYAQQGQSGSSPTAQPRVAQPPPRQPLQGHHAGQWLNQSRNLPADQQKRLLDSDPQFRSLPKSQQQELRQRLQGFSSLPPDRQQQILNRMETWEHLTPQQKGEAQQLHSEMHRLPPERRQAVENAIRALRGMPPEARQRAIDSGRFNDFSPEERGFLNGVTQLPLAPTEPEQTNPVPRPPH